ncbi:MAG: hypothetical protein AAFY22_01510, partial [Pseudomonadota bacterium]
MAGQTQQPTQSETRSAPTEKRAKKAPAKKKTAPKTPANGVEEKRQKPAQRATEAGGLFAENLQKSFKRRPVVRGVS